MSQKLSKQPVVPPAAIRAYAEMIDYRCVWPPRPAEPLALTVLPPPEPDKPLVTARCGLKPHLAALPNERAEQAAEAMKG